ncbi:hypothetical protein D049_2353A, partial [Vibrio parahaemolyticus VPTS-2010]
MNTNDTSVDKPSLKLENCHASKNRI